jgi:hypothetical protein
VNLLDSGRRVANIFSHLRRTAAVTKVFSRAHARGVCEGAIRWPFVFLKPAHRFLPIMDASYARARTRGVGLTGDFDIATVPIRTHDDGAVADWFREGGYAHLRHTSLSTSCTCRAGPSLRTASDQVGVVGRERKNPVAFPSLTSRASLACVFAFQSLNKPDVRRDEAFFSLADIELQHVADLGRNARHLALIDMDEDVRMRFIDPRRQAVFPVLIDFKETESLLRDELADDSNLTH